MISEILMNKNKCQNSIISKIPLSKKINAKLVLFLKYQ